MVTMNDAIAFIEKAMKENLDIHTTIRETLTMQDYAVNIYINNSDKKVMLINCINYGDKDYLIISKDLLDLVQIEVSKMDIALFKVEALKAHEYSKNKVIEAFNNFFEEKCYEPTTINDLDSEDD